MMRELTNTERARLEEYARRGGEDPLGRRALIVLRYASHHDTADIATELGITTRSVRRWRQSFEAEGMSIFPDAESSMADRQEKPLDTETVTPESVVMHRTVDRLIEESAFRLEHALHVRSLAGMLFRTLQDLHGIGQEHSRILEMAAYLHEIQSPDEEKSSPKRTMQYLHQFELEGFSPEQQRLLEILIRRQRGKVQADSLAEGSALPSEDVGKLIALLRLALALDTSETQSTQIEEIIRHDSEVDVIVAGPQAAVDAASAQRKNKFWSTAFSSNLRVLTDEQADREAYLWEEFPLPEPLETPGITSTDPLAEAGRKTLRFHFAEMLKHEPGTRLGEDIESLHDMRVAVRRMRVAFEVFSDAFTKKTRKRHLKGLREIGRALGRVRDLDVSILKAERYMEGLKDERREGLDPLTEAWRQQRDIARREMIQYLDSDAYRDFLRSFNAFVQSPGKGVSRRVIGRFGPHQVRHLAPRMIYDRFGSVRMFEPILAGASIEEVHELRIEFKKFRYTLEYLEEVLGPEIEMVIRQVKNVQDHLGDLNDADVACQILNTFLKDWESHQEQLPLTERQNPEPVVAYLAAKHAERHHLMVTFGETWRNFDSPEIRRQIASAVSAV